MLKSWSLLPIVMGIAAGLPCTAFANDHPDTTIDYQGCDGARWEATWKGNDFDQKQLDGGPGRVGPTLTYKTTDGSCWDATWDESIRKFHHKPMAGGAGHDDYIIGYLHWNGSKWNALRADRTHFYHIGPK